MGSVDVGSDDVGSADVGSADEELIGMNVFIDKGEEVKIAKKTKKEGDDEEFADQEMMSMNTLVQGTVGRARLEQTKQQQEEMAKVEEDMCETSGQEAAAIKPVAEQIIKTVTNMKVAEVTKPVQPVQVRQAKAEQTRQVSGF